MIFTMDDYRAILRSRFEQRQQRNPAYSLRAFARDIGLSVSSLSEVLNGRHRLSPAKAQTIAGQLGLNELEQEYFADLVVSQSARSELTREQARARLVQHRATVLGDDLALEHFAMISQWYHFAILELAKVKGFKSSITWIANSLAISKDDAKQAVSRLCRLGFLERRGKQLVLRKPKSRTQSSIPSDAIKDFHKQVLERAADALLVQALANRSFGSVVMAFDRERLGEAKLRLQKFREEFANEFTTNKNATSVYCLGLQFFGLDALGTKTN